MNRIIYFHFIERQNKKFLSALTSFIYSVVWVSLWLVPCLVSNVRWCFMHLNHLYLVVHSTIKSVKRNNFILTDSVKMKCEYWTDHSRRWRRLAIFQQKNWFFRNEFGVRDSSTKLAMCSPLCPAKKMKFFYANACSMLMLQLNEFDVNRSYAHGNGDKSFASVVNSVLKSKCELEH